MSIGIIVFQETLTFFYHIHYSEGTWQAYTYISRSNLINCGHVRL